MKCFIFLILSMTFGKVCSTPIGNDATIEKYFISRRKNVTISKDKVDIPVAMSIKVWDFDAKTRSSKVRARPIERHVFLTTPVGEDDLPDSKPDKLSIPKDSEDDEPMIQFSPTQINPVYKQVVILLPESGKKYKDSTESGNNNDMDTDQHSRIENLPYRPRQNFEVGDTMRPQRPVSLIRGFSTFSPGQQEDDLKFSSVDDPFNSSRSVISRNRNLHFSGTIDSRNHPTRSDSSHETHGGVKQHHEEIRKNSRETYNTDVPEIPTLRRFNWKVRPRDDHVTSVRTSYPDESIFSKEIPSFGKDLNLWRQIHHDTKNINLTWLADHGRGRGLNFDSRLTTTVPSEDQIPKNSTLPKHPKVTFTGGVITGLAVAVLFFLAVLIGTIVYLVRNAITSQKTDAVSTLNYTEEPLGGSTYIRNNIFLPTTEIEQPPSIETDSFNSMESTFLTFSEICLKSSELQC